MVHTVHFTIIAEWKVLDAKCAVRLLIKVQCHIFFRHKPKIQEE